MIQTLATDGAKTVVLIDEYDKPMTGLTGFTQDELEANMAEHMAATDGTTMPT